MRAWCRSDGPPGRAYGIYWVSVDLGDDGSHVVEYQRGQTTQIVVRFAPTATGVGMVEGVRGTRYADRVQVRLLAPTEKPGRQGAQLAALTCDAQGRFEIQSVQPGRYVAALAVGDLERHPPVVSMTPVALVSGANHVTLSLPALHTLRVRGAEARVFLSAKRVPGQPVSHYHLFASSEGADAVTEIDGIPAGTYTVQGGAQRKEVTLPGTAEIDLSE